jgi:hypothetical protein
MIPGSPNEQQCSAHQDPRNADQRRYRHCVPGLRLNLHWADVNGLFACCIREATIGKNSNSSKDQNYSGDFHRASGYTTICTTEW